MKQYVPRSDQIIRTTDQWRRDGKRLFRGDNELILFYTSGQWFDLPASLKVSSVTNWIESIDEHLYGEAVDPVRQWMNEHDIPFALHHATVSGPHVGRATIGFEIPICYSVETKLRWYGNGGN